MRSKRVGAEAGASAPEVLAGGANRPAVTAPVRGDYSTDVLGWEGEGMLKINICHFSITDPLQ